MADPNHKTSIRCDGCPAIISFHEACMCLADHSARLGADAPPYIFCSSCYAAHRISWSMLAEDAAHGEGRA